MKFILSYLYYNNNMIFIINNIRINNILEESYDNYKNNDIKISHVNNIDERVKNVEKTLQTITENKNNGIYTKYNKNISYIYTLQKLIIDLYKKHYR